MHSYRKPKTEIIYNSYMYDKKTKENEDKLTNAKNSMKVKCPNCGLKIPFYAFENRDRKICKMCNKFVYKNDEARKKYEEIEKKRKLEEFEKMIEKLRKEGKENANQIRRRNLETRGNKKNAKKTR